MFVGPGSPHGGGRRGGRRGSAGARPPPRADPAPRVTGPRRPRVGPVIADSMFAMADAWGAVVVLVAVAVLVAESGLLIGVVLPGISVTVGMGMLAQAGVVAAPWTATAAVAAAVAGPSVGYWLARRRGGGSTTQDPDDVAGRDPDGTARGAPDRVPGRRPGRAAVRVPGPARRLLRFARARPVVAVAVGQWFAVARTLMPRVAGAQLPYRRFVVVSAPVAAAWALATFELGRLLVAGSAAAARIVSAQQALAGALLAALAVVVVLTLARTARRGSRDGAPPGGRGARPGPPST